MSYDAWGRLLSVTEAIAGTVTYRRDALGRLIEREGPGEACGGWENHYYCGNEAVPVFSEAGGGGSQVAYVRSPATGRLLEVYTESEGPSRCVVDGRGEITGLIAFDESGTPYHFCWYDSEGSVEEEQEDGYPPCSGLWGAGWIWEGQFDLVLFTANSSFYFEQISDPPPAPRPQRGKVRRRYLENLEFSWLFASGWPKDATWAVVQKAYENYGEDNVRDRLRKRKFLR